MTNCYSTMHVHYFGFDSCLQIFYCPKYSRSVVLHRLFLFSFSHNSSGLSTFQKWSFESSEWASIELSLNLQYGCCALALSSLRSPVLSAKIEVPAAVCDLSVEGRSLGDHWLGQRTRMDATRVWACRGTAVHMSSPTEAQLLEDRLIVVGSAAAGGKILRVAAGSEEAQICSQHSINAQDIIRLQVARQCSSVRQCSQ